MSTTTESGIRKIKSSSRIVSSSPIIFPGQEESVVKNTSSSSEASVGSSSPPLLAFNGGTYTRPKKERKGLYFITGEDFTNSEHQHEPSSSVGSSSSGLDSATGNPDLLISSKSKPGDKKSNMENGNKIPTLKFSNPSIDTDIDISSMNDSPIHNNISNPEPFPRRKNISSSSAIGRNQLKNINNQSSNDEFHIRRVPSASDDESGDSSISRNRLASSSESDIIMKEVINSSSSGRGSADCSPTINHLKTIDDLINNGNHHVHNHSHSSSSTNEENFECVGEGSESFTMLDSSIINENESLHNFRDLNDSDLLSSPGGVGVGAIPTGLSHSEGSRNSNSLSRNGWQRTSLRKTPNNLNGDGMNHKRWGSFRNSSKRGVPVVPSSNALANQLYRSSSYHSSGRSSAGDGEEMYSDSSLEGEVIDLTKKVHHLEEKFTVLAENQNDVDDRYTRAKQENVELSTKLFMLEEQLRDVELRADEKVRDEQRRHKEVLGRLEREKQLQMENYEIKFQMMEKELSSTRIEVKRLEGSLDRERNDNNHLSDKCLHYERDISSLRDHNRELLNQNRVDRENMAMESAGSQQALAELKRQLESLSHFHMNGAPHSLRRIDSSDSELSELKSRLKEAEEEIKRLKQQNKLLQDTNEELSAQILNQGFEDGRNLLRNLNTSAPDENSLAAEFEAMSNDETDDDYGVITKNHSEKEALSKMKTALKDQKEANLALRAYIDGILLNIVEHYPQLLEVKNKNGFIATN